MMVIPSSSRDIAVFLIDDHQIVLHGLREFMRFQDGIRVVGSATSAGGALTGLATEAADVVLIDVRLPDKDGISLCREIRAKYPSTRCLILSSFGDRDATLEAVVAGASGYLLKDASLETVAQAIRDVFAGNSILDPAMTERAIAELRRRQAHPRDDLTAQERRVLDLLSDGLSNKEIADELYLAEQTVKNYVSSVLSKLGMRRIEAAIHTSAKRMANSVTSS